ncbi:MAG: hypothetical protein AAGD86_01540 [Pseudomonadota bacterium]
MSTTLVIQSHRQPLPLPLLTPCLASVRAWADSRGFAYRFVDDALFDALPADLRRRDDLATVVKTDLARLHALRGALDEGYDCAIWCDADCLCFAPDAFDVPDTDFALGREVWIQTDAQRSDRLRAYVKVHNAFMLFRRDNSFLDFYLGAATRLLRSLDGPCAPQFIGPKFLTAVHNIARCPVAESAGMLSPPVVADIVRGGGAALDLFRQKAPQPVAMVNLCASLAAGDAAYGAVVDQAVERLQGRGAAL